MEVLIKCFAVFGFISFLTVLHILWTWWREPTSDSFPTRVMDKFEFQFEEHPKTPKSKKKK